MKLSDAASYFDRTPVFDATTGSHLFYGQVDPYDDSKRDAGGAYRRILSVRPGTAIPASRVVRVFGIPFIVGAEEIDGLAEQHRVKYVIQRADGYYAVSRLSAFLSGTTSSNTWADPQWLKDAKELSVSSRMPQMYNVMLPLAADIRVNDVLWLGTARYFVLASRALPSGMKQAECLLLEDPVATATLTPRTYDPVAGAYSTSAPTSIACLKVRWQSLYQYATQDDARYQEGDTSLVVPLATVVANKDSIDLGGATWRILSVDVIADTKVLHARPL